MQPQNPAPGPPSPNPQYDFILKDKPVQKSSNFAALGLPKPVVYGALAAVVLIIGVIIYSSATNKGGDAAPYAAALARSQEITRESNVVAGLSTDGLVQNMIVTVTTTLQGEQAQISGYAAGAKVKISPASLAVDNSPATDAQMQTAATNGSLSPTYISYLNTQLPLYQAALKGAYNVAGPQGKIMISAAYSSVATILKSSLLTGH